MLSKPTLEVQVWSYGQLIFDGTASAMSESQKCSWATLVMCVLAGIVFGFWTGLICDVVWEYICENVPLAPTDPYTWG